MRRPRKSQPSRLPSIEVIDGARVVAAHPRRYERDREILAVEHYVELLARKPGAVAPGRIFGHLEEPYARVRTWCHPSGDNVPMIVRLRN